MTYMSYAQSSATVDRLLEGTFTFRRGSQAKLAFIILVYLDLLLTLAALSMGMTELNPFAKTIFENPWQLLAFKVLPAPFIAWLFPSILLIPSVLLMGGVVTWNTGQLLAAFF
jgi:hypothetical protein